MCKNKEQVHVHMYVSKGACSCTCVCVCVCRPEDSLRCFSLSAMHHLLEASWPEIPWIYLCQPSLHWHYKHIPPFLHLKKRGSWVLNSGPYVCKASELSPQSSTLSFIPTIQTKVKGRQGRELGEEEEPERKGKSRKSEVRGGRKGEGAGQTSSLPPVGSVAPTA